MKLTGFNPMIITKDPKSAISVFEALGFKRTHTKKEIGENKTTDYRMKDENGFHVDIVPGEGDWSVIRINVDNYDEAIEFLTEHGFRKPRHEMASKKVDTGSSTFTMMVAPSGFLVIVSQHIKDE
jgi:adenylate cyclase class IV